jgi:glucose-6-phosphate isomerase
MVDNQIIPFGQTFGKLVYKIKLFLYLDNDKNFEYKYSKKRINRKQLKNLAKYLLNDKTFCKFYRIIFELFIWISEEFRKQYSQNRSKINFIIDNIIEKAIDILHECKGRVIVTGMGKSGHIGRKIAATLSSTGTPSYFLHPAESTHGDSGLITRDDVVISISNSGETAELMNLLPLIVLPLLSQFFRSFSNSTISL